METVSVYITTPPGHAGDLGRALVEARLAACANVLPSVTSLYWWDGALQEDAEEALVLKTKAELVEALTRRVRELHPYTVPCVVVWPIRGGNPDFLAWVEGETL